MYPTSASAGDWPSRSRRRECMYPIGNRKKCDSDEHDQDSKSPVWIRQNFLRRLGEKVGNMYINNVN